MLPLRVFLSNVRTHKHVQTPLPQPHLAPSVPLPQTQSSSEAAGQERAHHPAPGRAARQPADGSIELPGIHGPPSEKSVESPVVAFEVTTSQHHASAFQLRLIPAVVSSSTSGNAGRGSPRVHH